MIVNENDGRVDAVGNGSNKDFPYDFGILSKADIEVVSDGIVKTVDVDYTVSGVGTAAGGTVSFIIAPAVVNVSLLRKQPVKQVSAYQTVEDFPAARLENDLGKAAMLHQMVVERLGRALKFAKKSLKKDMDVDDPVEGKFLRWKTGGGVDSATPTNQGALSSPVAIGDGGTGSVTAAAARTALAVASNAHRATHIVGGSDALLTTDVLDAIVKRLQENTPTTLTLGAIADGQVMRRSGANIIGESIVPLGHLGGLGMSNGVDAVNDIDMAIGEAASDDALIVNRVMMELLAVTTKQLDVAWAVGNNAGGRMSAAGIANTTYFVWLIKRTDTGVVDWGFDTSATAPTMPTNYNKKRRIGAVIRAGGTILAFVQDGDRTQLKSPIQDVSATPTTAETLYALSVPIGINVEAIVNLFALGVASPPGIYISDPAVTNEAPSRTVAPGISLAPGAVATYDTAGVFYIRTDTSGRIRLRATDASGTWRVNTRGWVDKRGRG